MNSSAPAASPTLTSHSLGVLDHITVSYYKLSNLKQTHYYLIVSLESGALAQLTWCLSCGSYKSTHNQGIGHTVFSSGGSIRSLVELISFTL